MNETIWETVISQPGYFGNRRAERHAEFDQRFGEGAWRIAWELSYPSGKVVTLDYLGMTILYEDAYYHFLNQNPNILVELLQVASDVYDDAPSNVKSGLNYLHQETGSTHIQDISLRRCVLRLGSHFQGDQLVQIRDKKGTHPLSLILSPGQVPFHLPPLIRQPEIDGWWKPGSAESYYQSNKVVQQRI